MSNVKPFPIRIREALTPAPTAQATPSSIAPERTFHFWRGASKQRYVHIVYDLLDCPELAPSNYILVHVGPCGTRTPRRIGRTVSRHGSENLAEIRHQAARLGANEVHLHVLAESTHDQAVVQWDLQAEHFGSLTDEHLPEAEQKSVGI